VTLPFDR